ncbi:MAG: hypothetical protein E6J90_04890 [Deltaproteobacteria bacterium]|nr:MAG: hypothetical protein E6J91_06940 [Deltaproteobacteria bacterium]TMQ26016.1 MAG: hypothetical protein E6J90_04890 [Deltaproteobacteria bacterium]
MTWPAGDTIRRIIKRDIEASDRGTIATLNDLPAWMIHEARAIARESLVCAVRYLRFYVSSDYSHRADDFIEDVLLKGQDARTWNIRDCICIPYEPTQTTALEVHYEETLAQVDGERWFRVKPKPSDHPSNHIPGAVGVVLRNTRYWEHSQQHISRFMFSRPDDLEAVPIRRLASSIRRWIAHRLAWWATGFLKEARFAATGDEIIAAVPEVNMERVTDDARIAAAALAREVIVYRGSPHFPQQAGFLGPEEWYQSPSDDLASSALVTLADKEPHH